MPEINDLILLLRDLLASLFLFQNTVRRASGAKPARISKKKEIIVVPLSV